MRHTTSILEAAARRRARWRGLAAALVALCLLPLLALPAGTADPASAGNGSAGGRGHGLASQDRLR